MKNIKYLNYIILKCHSGIEIKSEVSHIIEVICIFCIFTTYVVKTYDLCYKITVFGEI